jgi:hypothetical protein
MKTVSDIFYTESITGQPRGPSKDGAADAGETSETGRLPALDCAGLLALSDNDFAIGIGLVVWNLTGSPFLERF